MIIILKPHVQFWIWVILGALLICGGIMARPDQFLGLVPEIGIPGLILILLGSLVELQLAEFRAPAPRFPEGIKQVYPNWILAQLGSGVLPVRACLNLGGLVLILLCILALSQIPIPDLIPLPLVLGASLAIGYGFSELVEGWGISIPGHLGIVPGMLCLILGLDIRYIPGYCLGSGICLGLGAMLKAIDARQRFPGLILSLGGLRSLDGILCCSLVGGLIPLFR